MELLDGTPILPTTKFWPALTSHVLLDSVICEIIARVNCNILSTKKIKRCFEGPYNITQFISTQFDVYKVNDVLNVLREQIVRDEVYKSDRLWLSETCETAPFCSN